MAFIIWYQLEFEEAGPLGLPLLISNDVFSGQYILDADITVTMSAGAAADMFEARLVNLPAEVVDTLKAKHAQGLAKKDPLKIKIRLGYFDDLASQKQAQPVMEAAVTAMKSTVSDDGQLVTVVKGQELAGYWLRITQVKQGQRGPTNVVDFVKGIAQQTKKVEVVEGSGLTLTLENFTVTASNGLAALSQIARRAATPVVVRDGKILMGMLVGSEVASCPPLSNDTNIVKLDQAQDTDESPETSGEAPAEPSLGKPSPVVDVTVLGDPRLHVGLMVLLDATGCPEAPLRIERAIHRFSTNSGFTTELKLSATKPGEVAAGPGGIPGVVDAFGKLTEGLQDERPAIDTGQVIDYQDGSQKKHVVSLNYGQTPPPDAVTPSVQTPVGEKVQLFEMPIAAPFAWHKCGLVVPVYKGMRALLAHNRGLVSDAVVAGFVWPSKPRAEPPKSQSGDYWLCLPTELGGDDLPIGKAANDLVDGSGRRVIQAKALHILVGTSKLADVGERPQVPAEQTIIIEHESGTKITIDDKGGVVIDSQGPLTIKTDKKDIALTNGQVSIKLSGSAMEVS